MRGIKRGSHIIVNEADRPCTRLVACVDYVSTEVLVCHYMSKNAMATQMVVHPSRATLLEHFGVKVEFTNDLVRFRTIKTGPSLATYEDGRPREWQQSSGDDLWEELRVRLEPVELDDGWSLQPLDWDSDDMRQAGLPPAMIKSLYDEFYYEICLKDGTRLRYKTAKLYGNGYNLWLHVEDVERYEPVDGTGWVEDFKRGLDVNIENIVYVADSPTGS